MIDKIKLRSGILLIVSFFFVTFCSSPISSESDNENDLSLDKQIESLSIENLSPNEIEGLIFIREEEKLARDVYMNILKKWQYRVFSNISESEQRHMDAIKFIIDRYSLEDPIVLDEIGSFKNKNLSELYASLIVQGDISLIEALKVGATIEEIDILDLKKQVDEIVDNQDIKLVYNNLLRGSMNHLRAFVRNIEAQGETFSPKYLDAEYYNKIITSHSDRGNRKRGKRRGNVWGG